MSGKRRWPAGLAVTDHLGRFTMDLPPGKEPVLHASLPEVNPGATSVRFEHLSYVTTVTEVELPPGMG